jgi:hypothetical protein
MRSPRDLPCPGPLDRMWILSPAPSPRCRYGCSVPHLLHRSRGGSSMTGPLAFSCRQSGRVGAGFVRRSPVVEPRLPSNGPASVPLSRSCSSGSCRSLPGVPVERLETLRSTYATQLWLSKVAHGVRLRAGLPVRDDGAPRGASPSPQHVAAAPFLGTPSRAGRRSRDPLPCRPSPSCQGPHTVRALRELRSPAFPGGAQGYLRVRRAACDSRSTPAGSTQSEGIRTPSEPDAALAPAVIVACPTGWEAPGTRGDRDLPRGTVPGTVLWLRPGAFD